MNFKEINFSENKCIEDSVKDSFWHAVKDSVWDSLKNPVSGPVWDSVWGTVWYHTIRELKYEF